MKSFIYSAEDDWRADGKKITSPEVLSVIRQTLDDSGPVIVEHWFYRGSRSPDRFVVDDFETLEGYLSANAKPGDAFHIWEFTAVCKDDNKLAYGKMPDPDGLVPRRGAY